jgi:hypothetical protein
MISPQERNTKQHEAGEHSRCCHILDHVLVWPHHHHRGHVPRDITAGVNSELENHAGVRIGETLGRIFVHSRARKGAPLHVPHDTQRQTHAHIQTQEPSSRDRRGREQRETTAQRGLPLASEKSEAPTWMVLPLWYCASTVFLSG